MLPPKEIEAEASKERRRRTIGKADYQARGVLYLPEEARYSGLLKLAEGKNIGRAINDAMRAIEEANDDLKGVLPKTYSTLDNDTLATLLKTFSELPMDFDGDIFGRI
jgi:type I restriction enzyme M protein